MNTVQFILETKGSEVATIEQDATVVQAAEMMARKGIGALVVTKGTKAVGIFTERDVMSKVVAARRTSNCAEIISPKVLKSPRVYLPHCIQNPVGNLQIDCRWPSGWSIRVIRLRRESSPIAIGKPYSAPALCGRVKNSAPKGICLAIPSCSIGWQPNWLRAVGTPST